MSRGFVKEEDQEEAPLIPPRAALPMGVTNYVTQNGKDALLQERKNLEETRSKIDLKDEQAKRREQAVVDGKLQLLQERIASARVISLEKQPQDEVRFGAKVEFILNKAKQKFQIVGVDEADVKNKKISFTAPIAKALMGAKVNEKVDFKLGADSKRIKVLAIAY
ncbi:GreA/GreB family elongation factor [Mesonia ostreae]|uniref:GreA/GreB family elongation factor n=1 Tax=Mesonia ostreae TaxID=861110 RepID=A0ABU2KFZ0_9FLAO|nr:GreA/GreB family elongation factor [Mesonia ostreae]MDT0293611.1 GreA/GreB family elongation factor [Mesonia ostreae]